MAIFTAAVLIKRSAKLGKSEITSTGIALAGRAYKNEPPTLTNTKINRSILVAILWNFDIATNFYGLFVLVDVAVALNASCTIFIKSASDVLSSKVLSKPASRSILRI